MQKNKYQDSIFCFEYPINWQIEVDEDVISIYKSLNGFGAVQFSTRQIGNPSAYSLKEFFKEYLEDRHKEFEILEDFDCVSSSIIDSGRSWKYWLFFKMNILVFATYNCSEKDSGKEDSEVMEIVNSAIAC